MYEVDLHRDWLLSLVDRPSGGAILDLGCGKGADLLALATRMRDPNASFVGVDASAENVAIARNASKDSRVEFVHAKVGPALAFDDARFDVLLTQELLECLPNLDAFVPELARVLRPGGQLVASHYDWDTQIFNGSDRDRPRRILRAWAEWTQPWMDQTAPWMGRRLWGYLEGSGLFRGEVQVRVMTNTEFAEPWHGLHFVDNADLSGVRHVRDDLPHRIRADVDGGDALIGEEGRCHGGYSWCVLGRNGLCTRYTLRADPAVRGSWRGR